MAKVVLRDSGCLEWMGRRNKQGYGTMRGQYVHRLSWMLRCGPIADGECVLHHCDNPSCVKAVADERGPAHLFLGSRADNMVDMWSKGRGTVPKLRGSAHHAAKLTERDVLVIRRELEARTPLSVLAKRYSVSISTISLVRRGRIWRHVTEQASQPWPKVCGCGRSYQANEWGALPYVGIIDPEDGGPVAVLRNCECGSTLAIEREPAPPKKSHAAPTRAAVTGDMS